MLLNEGKPQNSLKGAPNAQLVTGERDGPTGWCSYLGSLVLYRSPSRNIQYCTGTHPPKLNFTVVAERLDEERLAERLDGA